MLLKYLSTRLIFKALLPENFSFNSIIQIIKEFTIFERYVSKRDYKQKFNPFVANDHFTVNTIETTIDLAAILSNVSRCST